MKIGTRGSRLARWQAERVGELLRAAHGVDVELVLVSTAGDVARDVPIHTIGGTGVFVKEVQQAVLDGRADLAVHSAKDLPSATQRAAQCFVSAGRQASILSAARPAVRRGREAARRPSRACLV